MMKRLQFGKKDILRTLLVVFANIICAGAAKFFLLSADLAAGGVTGIGILLQNALGIDVSWIILAVNILLLVLGAVFLSVRFALTSVVSSFSYPLALAVLNALFPNVRLTNDILLNTLFGGALTGFAIGLAFRAGASTGGMDIPPLILDKHLGIPAAVSMYVLDVIILLLQFMILPLEKILYGILFVATYTIIIEKMMHLGTAKTEIRVISEKTDEIVKTILSDIDRGATIISAIGGFTRDSRQLVFSVVSNRDVPKLEKAIHRIDPECFVIVSRISEVRGRGFTLSKKT